MAIRSSEQLVVVDHPLAQHKLALIRVAPASLHRSAAAAALPPVASIGSSSSTSRSARSPGSLQ